MKMETTRKESLAIMNDKQEIEDTVIQAKQGIEDAWTSLYQASWRDAYFTAVKVAGSKQEAYDLVHDAYLVAFEKLATLEDPAKFQPWLNMIVANKCRDYLRKKKPSLFSELQTDEDNEPDWPDDRDETQPELVLDHNETVRLIAEMIDGLPEDQKLCVTLYYRNMLNIGDIAKTLEVSEGTVKSRLNYARKKVGAKVQELEKQGVKLYSIAPAPLLIWLLKYEAATMEAPTAMLTPPTVSAGALSAGTVAASQAAATASTAAASSAVSAGVQAATTGIVVKVIAGITVASLLVGSAAVYHSSQEPEITVSAKPMPYVDTEQAVPYAHVTEQVTEPVTEYIIPTELESAAETEANVEEDEQRNLLEEVLDFSKGWMTLTDYGNYVFTICYAFESDGTLHYMTGFWESELSNCGKGTYSLSGNEITITLHLKGTPQSCTYLLDPEKLTLTQTSDVGFLLGHSTGTVLQLEEYPHGKDTVIHLATVYD